MPPRLLAAYLTRGFVLWTLVRVVAELGAAALRVNIANARPGVVAPLAVSALLCFVDFYRRREHTLVRNLGVAPLAAIIVSIIPVIAGEVIRVGLYGP